MTWGRVGCHPHKQLELQKKLSKLLLTKASDGDRNLNVAKQSKRSLDENAGRSLYALSRVWAVTLSWHKQVRLTIKFFLFVTRVCKLVLLYVLGVEPVT